jgi:hypothetical protein
MSAPARGAPGASQKYAAMSAAIDLVLIFFSHVLN